MKRIILLTSVVLLAAFTITSCVKNTNVNFDEGYWLSQERGEVVYSDPYCAYYVVETNYGYTVIRSWGNNRPYEGSMLYGNFGTIGTRDFYYRAEGVLIPGEVVEYDLTYADAQYAIEYYCPYGKAEKIRQSTEFTNKTARPAKTPSGTGNQ